MRRPRSWNFPGTGAVSVMNLNFITMEATIVAAKSFAKYIDLVKDQDLIKALKKTGKSLIKLLEDIPEKRLDYRYAEGKWTIRQSFQHIIDTERVFSFRAVWFSRNDGQPLPGFDENNWAMNATADDRDWEDMIKEFQHLRAATILLFKSLSKTQLAASGFASNNLVTVTALGFIAAGHVQHHINVYEERYLIR